MTPDRIMIHQLAVDCIVGTFPHEREKPQRILLDLTLECDLAPAGRSDDLTKAPDYLKAAAMARVFCIERKAQLLEALAEGIAERLLDGFPVETVVVRVTKPLAIPDSAGASVEVRRERGGRPAVR